MESSTFRQLLPAPARHRRLDPSRNGKREDERALKRVRTVNQRACDTCRTHKLRCNGASPKCGACLKRKVNCTYHIQRNSAIEQEEYKQQADILQQLRRRPESQAIEIFRRLRSAPDGHAAIAAVADNLSGQYQPSAIRAARASSPPTFSRFEFELSVRHRIAYPALPPIDMNTVSLEPLSGRAAGLPRATLELDAPRPSSADLEYCDERLRQLDIGYWTTVPISNTVAANIISTYLRIHPIWGFFDPQLFIRDLVDKKLQFCSSFLVNALLSCACQSYGAVDPQIPSLSSELMTITERFWRAERSRDSVLNVAAMMMFSLSCYTTPTEANGFSAGELIEDGRRMAERLHLFGVQHTDEYAAKFASLSEDWKRATAFIAWGAYCWMTLIMYYNPGIRPIAFPPLLPIPTSVVDGSEQRLGVEWPANPLPDYMGKTFPTLCKFQIIMQEVAAVYLAQPTLSGSKVPLAFAEAKYHDLLAWTDTLNDEMAHKDHSPDHVIILHILLHTAVLGIFRPFTLGSDKNHLHSFSSQDSFATTAVRSSVNQLKRIMAACRTYHPGILTHAVTAPALIHLSNVMLSDAESFSAKEGVDEADVEVDGNGKIRDDGTDDDDGADDDQDRDVDPEWHSYFLLCLANSQDLLSCFSVFTSVIRGFLSMALQKGVISVGEARALMRSAEARAQHHPAAAQGRDFGAFVVDLDLAAKAPEAARVSTLSRKFKEMLLFDEFTINEDYTAGENT